MSITVTRCSVDELWSDDGFPSVVAAYAAEGAYSGMPMPEPCRAAYDGMERQGVLFVIRADCGGELVGFAKIVVTTSPHYGVPLAVLESVFVMREHRGAAGLPLIRAVADTARAAGAHSMIATAPIGSRLGRMLAKIGFAPTSTTFLRRLQ